MYELRSGQVYVRLSEDLNTLEYGKGKLCFKTKAPFQFIWGVAITPENIMKKEVFVRNSEISIDFSEFVFHSFVPFFRSITSYFFLFLSASI